MTSPDKKSISDIVKIHVQVDAPQPDRMLRVHKDSPTYLFPIVRCQGNQELIRIYMDKYGYSREYAEKRAKFTTDLIKNGLGHLL